MGEGTHRLLKAKKLPWCHWVLLDACLSELADNVFFGHQAKVFVGSCLPGGTLHKTAWEDAAAGHWVLLAVMEDPGAEETHTLYRNWMLEQPTLQKLAKHAHQNQEANPFLSALSQQHLLQTKFNVMPVGNAKIFKGPRCMLREQIKRLNLAMIGNKLITGIVIFWYSKD